jgi:hypothetical protein
MPYGFRIREMPVIERVRLKTPPKKKRGRPATGANPLVAVRVPAEVLVRIEAVAKIEHTTRSEVMRILLEAGLKAPQRKRRP